MTNNQKFPKTYRLCSRKRLGELHTEGLGIKKYPFRWKLAQNKTAAPAPFQIAISIPKRRIPKAHDRNRIKRLVKEAFRQNKADFESLIVERGLNLSLLLVYYQSKELSFTEIETQMRKSFRALTEEIQKDEKALPIID